MAAHVVAYAVIGLVLVTAGPRDARAKDLGVVLVLVAAIFASSVASLADRHSPTWTNTLHVAFGLRVDAFLPLFVWRFAADFPRLTLAPRDRGAEAAKRLALAVGWVLFVTSALARLPLRAPVRVVVLAQQLAPGRQGDGVYFTIQLALSFAALVWSVRRTRRASGDERRRASLLVAGLAMGTAPAILWVTATTAVPGLAPLVPLHVAGWVIYPALLAVPVVTAYAVVVRRALDVRLVVRRAIQYALARSVAIALCAVPSIGVVALLLARRTLPVGAAVADPRILALAIVAAVGAVALRGRRGLLTRLDRRFYRDQHEIRRRLLDLTSHCRSAADWRELAEALRTGIGAALGPTSVAVLRSHAPGREFAGDGCRALDRDASLVEALSRTDALEVDFERTDGAAAAFSDSDRNWLLDAEIRLLLPMRDAGGQVEALVAIGDKRNELPYSAEERMLLRHVAGAAEAAMRAHARTVTSASMRAVEAPAYDELRATECDACAIVASAVTSACPRCGRTTRPCALPRIVGGKYRVDVRIGRGGMGVVYRGLDLHLGRAVAIKTLPHLAPAEAVRLRREARAVAMVSHPNLGLIYATESWGGQPLLVFEYLPGGTLAARLPEGAMSVAAALRLGVAMCDVLELIHGAGVLHRDIKPSNIGFAADGTPKLLDFGLARLMGSAVRSPERHPSDAGDEPWSRAGEASGIPRDASESLIAGTPMYMSPEALLGAPADAQFDLWGLCVVLYECVAGRHPLRDAPMRRFDFHRQDGGIVDVRTYAPDAGPHVANFFEAVLAPASHVRPRTASALRNMLLALDASRPGARR